MKNNIMTIVKKECVRLFSDKRLLFTSVVLPGLMIFVMYSLMGNLMSNIGAVSEDYTYQIYAVNMPESISDILKASSNDIPFEIINVSEADIDSVKQKISDQETDLLVAFPADFDALVEAYNVTVSSEAAPNVQIWSNMARTESTTADSIFKELLNTYESGISNKFDIQSEELATTADMFATYIVFMLPMLLIMFMFVGCQAIAPESIAGEKERGTLGTLLATPVKRSDIAFAKILSISIFGILGALGSFVGLMASLPKMMNVDGIDSIDFYSVSDYALILVIAVSTVLVFVSALSLLSAYSKSIKEANSYTMPFMILSIVCGLSGMVTGGAPKEFYYYLIPVFNSAQCLTGIFKFEVSAVNIAVTVATNLVFMLICTFALSKMFNSEKIVFDK